MEGADLPVTEFLEALLAEYSTLDGTGSVYDKIIEVLSGEVRMVKERHRRGKGIDWGRM